MSQTPFRYDWDYSDYARLPDDGNRYEVIDGELLVTPGPTPHHQHYSGNLFSRLREYVLEHKLGVLLFDVDVLFVEGNFLRPDLVFVPAERKHGIVKRGIEVPPGLIIEILSPTSSSIDMVKKPRRFGDFGVPEYWVVDPEQQCVWVWRFAEGKTEPARIETQLTWTPAESIPPFSIALSELFRPL